MARRVERSDTHPDHLRNTRLHCAGTSRGTRPTVLLAEVDLQSGAVLFDLFTGRTPFPALHALSVIKQAAEKPARNCVHSLR